MRDAIFFVCMSLGVVFFMVAALLGIQGIDYAIQSVPIKITVDGAIVFEGRSACASVESAGAATRVYVRGGFLCMFPKSYHVGKSVEVITLQTAN